MATMLLLRNFFNAKVTRRPVAVRQLTVLEYYISLQTVPDFDPEDALDTDLSVWWLNHPWMPWEKETTYAKHVRMTARDDDE